MFKKPQVVNGARRGGKLSGIGPKMERIFRTTFRKEQSESREQLHPAIEDQHDEELKAQTAQEPRQKVVETDLGSRVSLVAEKSPRKGQHIVEFPEETHKQVPRTVNTRKIRQLERLEHVQSQDLESHSVDVIADVHGENSGAVSPKIPKEIVETVLDISSEDLDIEQEILKPSLNEKPPVDSTRIRQRKRWSKETSIVLPPKRNSQSSSSASERSNHWANEAKPIPAPRLNKIVDIEENRGLGLDNQAYEPEDSILRIETEQIDRQSTIIEIKPINHESSNSSTILKPKSRKNDNSPDKSTERESSSLMSVKSKKSSVLSRKSIHTTSESSSSILNSRTPKEPQSIKKATKTSKLERKQRSSSSNLQSATSDDCRVEKKSAQRAKRKKTKIPHDKKAEEIKYISVKIHKADMLVPDYITKHPMVIVHLIEESTGNYLKHSDESKTKPRYLQPLITGIYDFKEHKTMAPNWDEELIFEHDFCAISNATENKQMLIFFEIVDLPSFADASNICDEFGGGNCWYRIAWAFLKPLNPKGVVHLEKTVRLQLYRPKRSLKKSTRLRCEPYSWWKSKSREKYPSTLYVTVASVDPPKLEPIFYGQLSLEPLQEDESNNAVASTDMGNLPRWSRLAAQSCKIPNKLAFKTSTTDNGCFYTVFSNSGQYLACANCEEYDYPITIYKIDEGKVFVMFTGHKSFIYALDWSSTDEMLLSVSSDQTARLWDVENKIVQEIHMLPHPSYVYCGKFEPSSCQIVVTGCYDRVARLWSRNKATSEYELVQELEAHDGYVNAICFLKDGDLITGDSLGIIIQWTIKKRGRLPRDWQISRKIKIREIVNVPINTISLHPLGSRLLVHSRDSGLLMLDLATGVVLQRYLGLKNTRIQSTARISPCGGMIMCGGEDATLSIWSVESGKLVAKYQTGSSNAVVTCVDYHPYDHVLAYSIFGTPSETLVLKFDKHASGESVGLNLLTKQTDKSVASDYSAKQRDVKTRTDDSICGINDCREDLQSRLRIFNDSEGLLKMRSANRLTSIIAKIDRILSNSGSTQKSYDIEANRFENSSTMTPYVPPLFETFENKSSSESQRSTEIFEMSEVYPGVRTKRGRSKSAQHRKSSKKYCDVKIPLSDTTRKTRVCSNVCETFTGSQTAESASNYREQREESAKSGGTYVIDVKTDDKLKSGSSSMRSDMTFVIENEKPIPKPRKKS